MATDYKRDIARQLERLVAEQHQMNKRLNSIEEALIEKQFDDWVAPPMGTVYQNIKGCVMMSRTDFEKMEEAYNAREDR